MKLIAFALIGMITCGAASAQVVGPFASDGCVPGYTAQGQFVDEQGTVLDSEGWIATPEQTVLNSAGDQVFLKEPCTGIIRASRSGGLAFASGGGLIWAGAGALLVGLAAGGSSSTGSTTGTTN